MTASNKQTLAERLTRLSDELHAASGEIEAVGWPRHSIQLSGMSSLTSIYAHQLRDSVMTVDEALAGLEDEIRGGA